MNLETVTGNLVDLNSPDPATISIEDIAWGLSRIARFAGQTITTVPYTVAQHSVFVAREVQSMVLQKTAPVSIPQTEWDEWQSDEIMQQTSILKALLHDAAEAYTGDLPSPFKQIPDLHPIVKRIEARLMESIYEICNLPADSPAEVAVIKYADRVAQKIEAHAFMPSRGKDWPGLPEVSLERLQQFESPKDSLSSYREFMEFFKQLSIR